MMNNKYTSIDLFCGCGGQTLGMKMAGVESKLAIDFDENACNTFRKNFPDTPVICGDITTITKKECFEYVSEDIDILVMSPSCQGFSLANKNRNKIADDPRNKLFYSCLKFIEWYNPKAIIMENVKGLLSMHNGKVIETILAEFSNCGQGYNVSYKVLKASDYGVPQNRERVILIGYRKDLNISPVHPEPIAKFVENPISVWDAINDLPQIEAKEGTEYAKYDYMTPRNDYQRLMRGNDRIDDSQHFWRIVHNHVAMNHSPRIVERFKHIKQGQNLLDVFDEYGPVKRGNPNEKSSIKFSQNNFRIIADKPAPTIAASFQSNFIHPYLNRNLTAREGARLQSFPDNFIFTGFRTKMSWQKGLSQYQQIGNAVPPLLSKAIGETVINSLKKQTK